MLSTLAFRKVGLKSMQCVRVFSATPAQLCNVPQTEAKRELLPNEDLVPSSDIIPQTLEQKVQNWKNANDIFFGPDRDLKNFPHPVYKVKPTETYQLGFIPTRWFKALYPRLGVSGSYTLFWGTALFLICKENVPVNADFFKAVTSIGLVFYISTQTKVGDLIRNKLDATADKYDDEFYHEPLKQAKSNYLKEIDEINTEISRKDAIPMIFQAKQEQLELQLETEYRQRLMDAYTAVRSRLEYQADVESAQRHFEQDHMVNWIVSSVQKSITPQQEKETITSCIQTLKNISATATV